MADIESKVPDIGGHGDVPVIEILVAVGDTVKKDQGLVTLESDKATMEVPAIADGVIKALKVKLGDTVSEGALIAVIAASDGQTVVQDSAAAASPAPAPAKVEAPAHVAIAAPATPAPQAATSSGRKADIECAMVVIGAGPGGYTAAFRSADLGVDTVLIERYASLGGVCLNVGCIPSKALLHAADVIDQAAHARDYGVDFGAPKINIDTLRGYKDKVVGQLTKGLAGMAKQRKVRVVQGSAISSPACTPTMPPPMMRWVSSSNTSLVKPSVRDRPMARPKAAHGNLPTPTFRPLAFASVSVTPTQAISGSV
jgi:dihydrolipoamide dehydrogenase